MEEVVDIVVNTTAAVAGIAALTAAFANMRTTAGGTGAAIDRMFESMASGLNRLQAAFLSLRSVIVAFGSVLTVLKTVTENLTKFQAFISAMSVSTGSVKEARVEFAFLMGMADRLGISIKTLQHNYAQMSAAAMGSTITTTALRKVFESFSIAARVMHLSTIDTRLMFYALTQMVSKGTVSMEELRRQLGEKLPGAMNIAARSVNASMKDFEEAVRKGMVDSAKFLPIFADEVRRSFGPGLALAANALDAELNRLSNTLQKMIIRMYDAGVADAFTKVIKELVRLLSDPKIGDAFADALKNIADEATKFLQTITPESVNKAVNGFSSAMKAIGNAITQDLLPFLKEAGAWMGYLLQGWLVLKGASAGAAAGQLVAPGPVGAIGGAIAGGSAAYAATERAKQKLAIAATTSQRDVKGQIRYTGSPLNVDPWAIPPDAFFNTQSTAKLKDVLADGKKKAEKASPFMTFLQSLKEKDITQDEDTNKYDALRERANYLAKKEPKKAQFLDEALKLIDEMEARGVEFKPLIDRISGLVATQTRDGPAEIERRVEEMIAKYPKATAAAGQARDLAARYRTEYEDKLKKEQELFNAKQDEILRRLQVEAQLYDEQLGLVTLTNDEREKAIKKLELQKRLEEEIVRLRDEVTRNNRSFDEIGFRGKGQEQIEKVIQSMDRLQKANRDWYNGLQKAVADYASSATDGFKIAQEGFSHFTKGVEDGFVELMTTGKISFKSLADTFIAEIHRMMIRWTIAKASLDFTGQSGGFGGTFGTILGAVGTFFGANAPLVKEMVPGQFSLTNPAYGAKGMAFAKAFANGAAFTNSIVNKPTYFKFADGIGVMGEAGEEAIMPLGRDSQGRLGVRGQGGGPVVILNVYPQDADSFIASKDQVIGTLQAGLNNRARRMN